MLTNFSNLTRALINHSLLYSILATLIASHMLKSRGKMKFLYVFKLAESGFITCTLYTSRNFDLSFDRSLICSKFKLYA